MRGVLAAALVLVALAARAGEPDPRVAEADALLADAHGFARAVELYRAALADAPGDRLVRQRLARVLAWSERYDESIAEYDRLLAEAQPSDGSLELERAEVLSWAGRSAEAVAGFESVLARDPPSARAARGLARAYRWSGRSAAADRAYERALALEEDAEARREWTTLRAGFPPRAGAESELYADSEEFRRIAARASASSFPDLDTLLLARAGVLDLRGPRVAGEPGLARRDRGGELVLGVRRALGERVQAELELGARLFREAGAVPLAKGRLQVTFTRAAVLGLEVDHRDALDRTDSVAALEDGIRDTTVRLTLWKGLPRRLELFAEAQAGALSDSNLRSAAAATLSWQPWAERELRLHVGGGYLGYTRRSELYYDPDYDLSGLVGVSHRERLPHRLELDLEARGGFGAARQDGVRGRGPAYEVAGSLAWRVGAVRLALRASRAQSQRESSYTANRIFATIGLDLGR
jgi:tetratricopeptide (TPR) repeat protein